MEDTIFGKITRGEIPTDFLYEDDLCVVIKDIYPQAPTHVLIIPRKPIPMLSMASEEDQTCSVIYWWLRAKLQTNWGSLMRSAWSLITVQVVAKRYSIYTYISSLVET